MRGNTRDIVKIRPHKHLIKPVNWFGLRLIHRLILILKLFFLKTEDIKTPSWFLNSSHNVLTTLKFQNNRVFLKIDFLYFVLTAIRLKIKLIKNKRTPLNISKINN